MRNLPIRLRLATWYFVVFATVQLAFGASMWMALRHSLYAIVDENLDERVESVRRFIDSQKKNADLAKMREELAETYDVEPEGRYLQVYTGSGELEYQARALAGVALPPVPLTSQPGPAYSDLNVEQQPLRFATQRVAAHGSTYVIQIGVSTAQTQEALVRFFWGLLLIAPTLLLIASFGGYLISRRALAPVDAITSQAHAIGEQSLGNRLQKFETHDELQRLSDTLNEMLERIEVSFRRVTRFTADASHELRTPLSLIRMESELALRKQRGPAEYREALGNIQFQSVKTGELLEDLLALARGDAGRETLHFTALDLCARVRAVADSWSRPAREKMLQFSRDCPDGPIWIHGDQGALERLVTILLDNSFKFTPAGGSVTVSLSEKRGLAELRVTDTGIGIAPEHHRKIFERFYRVDDARSSVTGGSGLGLAIAEWIITQHNGSIQVDSAAGVGSIFAVLIPLARQNDRSAAAYVGTEHQIAKEQRPCHSGAQSSPWPRETP